MKKLIAISIVALFYVTAHAQASAEAKAALIMAEESYKKGDYKAAIEYLEQCRKKSKPACRILYLQVMSEMELAKDAGDLQSVLKTITAFEKAPDIKTFDSEKVMEVMKAKVYVNNKMAAFTAAEKEEKEAKAKEAYLKQREKELGGIIVYEKDGHGLVVAHEDLGKMKQTHAIESCDILILNNFDDWYLPSAEELKLIYENVHKKGLGNFQQAYYWSSTRNKIKGTVLNFLTAAEGESVNFQGYFVRPVRKF